MVESFVLGSANEPASSVLLMEPALVMGSLIVSYFPQLWRGKSGFGLCFRIQATIVAMAMVISLVIHSYSHPLRSEVAWPCQGEP
jgi:hypothetical protein